MRSVSIFHAPFTQRKTGRVARLDWSHCALSSECPSGHPVAGRSLPRTSKTTN